MIKKFLTAILFILIIYLPLNAKVNYSIGINGGFAPSLGGNLDSMIHYYFDSDSGIDGMNRSLGDYKTSDINRLFGLTIGFEFKTIIQDFYLIRLGANYSNGVFGGEGKTLITPDNTNYYLLECKYSFSQFDVPLTLGLAIPFWKDMMLSLSCGIAYANATYKNEFKSGDTYPDPFEREGEFKGYGYPFVVILEGEYFFLTNASLTSTLSYYYGSTEVLKDRKDEDTEGFGGAAAVDFAEIDFTGYRFTFGVSYYFFSI